MAFGEQTFANSRCYKTSRSGDEVSGHVITAGNVAFVSNCSDTASPCRFHTDKNSLAKLSVLIDAHERTGASSTGSTNLYGRPMESLETRSRLEKRLELC